jgi:hypothetical protein
MLQKIIIKTVLLCAIIAVLNCVYNITLYKHDLNNKCEQANEISNTQDTTDVYYFAESSNLSSANDDSTKLNISQLTNLFFPSLKITAINKPATHAGIFKLWLNQINISKHPPKAIIITLNMRSFDAAWRNSKLETSLQESMMLVQPYPNIINRFLLSLQAFDNKTEQQREQEMLNEWKTKQLKFPGKHHYNTVREWDDAQANGSHKKPDGTWDNEKIALACHNIKSFAFNIEDDNPRVKDFDEIAKWCTHNEVNLYFNLLADNVQYADSLVGKDLTDLMYANRDYLVKRYSKKNCILVDNFDKVNGSCFIDQNWTTEHYNYKGRMVISKNIALSMKKQFLNSYKCAY